VNPRQVGLADVSRFSPTILHAGASPPSSFLMKWSAPLFKPSLPGGLEISSLIDVPGDPGHTVNQFPPNKIKTFFPRCFYSRLHFSENMYPSIRTVRCTLPVRISWGPKLAKPPSTPKIGAGASRIFFRVRSGPVFVADPPTGPFRAEPPVFFFSPPPASRRSVAEQFRSWAQPRPAATFAATARGAPP